MLANPLLYPICRSVGLKRGGRRLVARRGSTAPYWSDRRTERQHDEDRHPGQQQGRAGLTVAMRQGPSPDSGRAPHQLQRGSMEFAGFRQRYLQCGPAAGGVSGLN